MDALAGTGPVALVPVDRPRDANNNLQGLQFTGWSSENLNQLAIPIDADSGSFAAVTSFRVSLLNRLVDVLHFLLNIWNVEYKPANSLTAKFSVDYTSSEFESFTPKSCAIAAGAATGGALTALLVPATVTFTCIKLDETRHPFEAEYKPDGKKMTVVQFPDYFTDCKDVEVTVKDGILDLNIWNSSLLLATVIDTIKITLVRKNVN